MNSALSSFVPEIDEPVRVALRTHHAGFARTVGRALAYDPAVASFCALPEDPTEQDWADLAQLLGPGGFVDLFSGRAVPPASWPPVFTLEGLQLIAETVTDDPSLDAVPLGPTDVDDMLALVELTRPGPFWPRSVETGTWLGVRDGGRLVAMAGERLRTPGWTEISGVCTAPDARGRGFAGGLVRRLATGIAARGDRAYLHVATTNPALALYERLGFVVRREVVFRGFSVPES